MPEQMITTEGLVEQLTQYAFLFQEMKPSKNDFAATGTTGGFYLETNTFYVYSWNPVTSAYYKIGEWPLAVDLGTLIETLQVLTISGSAATFAAANGNVAVLTVTGNVTISITPSEGTNGCRTMSLWLKNAGAYTISWPSSLRWENGVVPEFATSGWDRIDITKLSTENMLAAQHGGTWAVS